MGNRLRVAPAVVGLGAICLGWAHGRTASDEAKYRTHAEISSALNQLAAAFPRTCTVKSIGTSREGRAIWALRLAGAGDVDPDSRPALLLVANVDGDHLVGSEVAIDVAARLLGGHPRKRAMGDRRCAMKSRAVRPLYDSAPIVSSLTADHFSPCNSSSPPPTRARSTRCGRSCGRTAST